VLGRWQEIELAGLARPKTKQAKHAAYDMPMTVAPRASMTETLINSAAVRLENELCLG